MQSRRLMRVLCSAILACVSVTVASAQSGTIRFIVGTAPGGAIDPYARLIADHMAKTLGQPIILDHKPGASGTLAAQFVVEAPADGALLWVGTQAMTEINPNAFPNARWSIDQFRPIIRGVEDADDPEVEPVDQRLAAYLLSHRQHPLFECRTQHLRLAGMDLAVRHDDLGAQLEHQDGGEGSAGSWCVAIHWSGDSGSIRYQGVGRGRTL